ncbi:hypothetical protein NQP46_13025 [Streptomyces albus]|nr:hypothetical protein NQP46_13025 [Streptomyces albus]
MMESMRQDQLALMQSQLHLVEQVLKATTPRRTSWTSRRSSPCAP